MTYVLFLLAAGFAVAFLHYRDLWVRATRWNRDLAARLADARLEAEQLKGDVQASRARWYAERQTRRKR